MIILSWNCQGLGNPRAVRDLCRLVKEKKLHLVFLMETKLQAYRLEKIRCRTRFESVFAVNSIGRSGGLALLWSLEVEVDIQNYSHRHINAVVKKKGELELWKFTGLYGHPEAARRYESWALLRHLGFFHAQCMAEYGGLQ